MKAFRQYWVNVSIAILMTHTVLYACQSYFPPTAVIDIQSYPLEIREIQVDVNTSLSFKGNRSYDNDEYGQSIVSYKWYVWDSIYGWLIPESPTYTTSSSTSPNHSFGDTGQYYVRLVVVDNDEQPSTTNGTSLNTCVVNVVSPTDRPTVKNISVTSVDDDSALISGELLSVGSGGGTCTIDLHWGTTQAGEYRTWDHSQEYSSSQGVDTFQDTISATGGFDPGTLYYFRFQATNNINSVVDWADIGDPNCYRFVTPPGQASNPVVSNSVTTSPTLTWESGDSNYTVLHDVYLGTNPSSILAATHDSSEYMGRFAVPYYKTNDLNNNTPYYWRVDEVVLDPYNSNNERLTKSVTAWTFTTGIESPINVLAYAGDEKVYLIWNMSDNTGVNGYNLYRAEVGTSYEQINSSLITGLGCEDTGLTNEKTYYYYVVAVDSVGNESAHSEEVSVTPQAGIGNVTFVDDDASGGNPNGSISNPYGTIQTAINAASTGDEIIVLPGTYTENINYGDKILIIRSIDPTDWDIVDSTIVQGDGSIYTVSMTDWQTVGTEFKGFTVTNSATNIGIRVSGDTASPFIENCIVENCTTGIVVVNADIMYINNCKIRNNTTGMVGIAGGRPIVTSSLIYQNDTGIRSILNPLAEVYNCTIVDNTVLGVSGVPVISNCIVWNNGTDLDNCTATYSCISNGDAGEGNISVDPLFIAPDNHDYRLSIFSPCIDAGDNDVWENVAGSNDIHGQDRKLPGWYVDDTGNGDAPIVDMGADEWSLELNDSEIPYLTSFEGSSGFEFAEGFSSLRLDEDDERLIDGWKAESGYAYIQKVQYYPNWTDPNDTNDYKYQYLDVNYDSNGSTISREFDPNHPAEIIRVNCIPCDGAFINLVNDDAIFASVKFYNGSIHLGDGQSYQDTEINYSSVASTCTQYLGYSYEPDPRPELYSYENTWIEFEIHLDWNEKTYSVIWKHQGAPGGEIVAVGLPFGIHCKGMSKIELMRNSEFLDEGRFKVNRISVSNEADSGGVLGEDIRIDLPIADMDHPIKGHVPVIGDMWYGKLGKYVIKACPVAEYSDPPKTITVDEEEVEVDPWMVVVVNGCTKLNANLGYWMTQTLQNGDYYLKLEVYDDLGCLIAEEIMSEELQYYQVTKTVFKEFPVVGRAKGNTYHYEEIPDITVNWPGSFPFEFKRTYNHALRKNIYPLFFGWTHNHNIRLTENCSTQWAMDSQGVPLSDENGLGIGKIWLSRGLGCQIYMGQVDAADPNKVIYRPCDQYERDYIVRTTSAIDATTDPNSFDVTYVHYNPADGMMLTFAKDDVSLNYMLPDGVNEGVVDWMTSIGIGRQEDRFGNALVYTWQTDTTGASDLYITEIANNRTPVKLVFENNFKPFDNPYTPETEGPSLYSQLNMVDSDGSTYIAIKYDGEINSSYANYYYRKADSVYFQGRVGNADQSQTSMSYDVDFDSFSIDMRSFQPALYYYNFDPQNCDSAWLFEHYSDGTIKQTHKYSYNFYWGWGPITQFCSTEDYSYSYDSDGRLNTTVEFWAESLTGYYEIPIKDLVRIDHTVTVPEGKVVSQETTTFMNQSPGYYNQAFDPYQYWDPYDVQGAACSAYQYLYKYSWHIGGGGNLKTEYIYNDTRFPLKPTRIIEFFDDDGDDIYDRRKLTTYQYDDYSRTVEQRVYVDPNNYLLTEYEYHDAYDFPVRQTGWQGYCVDDISGAPIKSETGKIEKQWIYGLYDGTVSNDPNLNIYLVQETQLLDDKGTPSTEDDDESQNDYEYYQIVDNGDGTLDGGQVKTKKVWTDVASYNVDYYSYDGNGFLNKEWNGVPVDSNGDLVLNIDGYPLKPGTAEIVYPQKRYLSNDRGLRLLEADYLGKVVMNLYDTLVDDDPHLIYENCSRIAQTRTYEDSVAVSIPDALFVVSRYDDDLEHDPDSNPADNDTWETRTIYENYTYYGKPRNTTLPTGATISQGFFRDSDSKHFVEYPESSGYSRRFWGYDYDGKVLETYLSRPDGYKLRKLFAYNSLGRPVHVYGYNYSQYYSSPTVDDALFPNPYLTHEESGYLASGEKTYEKVWKIKRAGFELNVGFEEPVLEKCVGYDYDILGRMTAQATWIDPDAVDPNHLVPETYDPICMVVKFGYDAIGNRIYVIDPKGNVLFTDYDNANRKIVEYFAVPADDVIWNSDGSLDYENTKLLAATKTVVEYYLNGKVKKQLSYDYNGTLLAGSEFIYDSRGRIQQVLQIVEDTNENNQMDDLQTDTVAVTTYEYSDDGSLVRESGDSGYHIVIEDAEGKRTGIQLTYHGKPTLITYPSRDYEEYIYYDYPLDDSLERFKYNGLLEKKAVWKDGVKQDPGIRYEYDEFGKVSKVIYPDNGGYLEYEYTPRILGEYGKVEKIIDCRHADDRPGSASGLTYEFTYDSHSENLISYKDPDEYTFEYDYNTAYNRITSIDVKNHNGLNIYMALYSYDLAGRLRLVDANDLYTPDSQVLAGLDYDANGNRQQLNYYLDRTETGGNVYTLQYTSSPDNFLTSIYPEYNGLLQADYIFDAADSGDIDGLGRLRHAEETMYIPGQGQVSHRYDYTYNMRSELMIWQTYDWNGGWVPSHLHEFAYDLDGNVNTKTIDQQDTSYGYNGDLMTSAGGVGLDWDDNGQLTSGIAATFTWNWNGKLRTAAGGTESIHVKYDPMGNRVWKQTSDGENTTACKYIVDISGGLPVILCVLDGNDPNILKSSYFYADGQILAQKDHDPAHADKMYFYVHDRLGSVRQVMDYHELTAVLDIAHSYGYTPFGQFNTGLCYDAAGEASNPFMFTGQWYDAEIGQYYLRARMYDPELMRFTSRDPIRGFQQESLTLHKYLYCINDPVNMVDRDGEIAPAVVYMVAKVLVGGIIGGVSSGVATNWDKSAMAVGMVCGMLSAAVPGPILGTVAGSLLGAGSAMYNSYENGNNWDRIKLDGFIGLSAGLMSGRIGAMFGGGGGLSGLISFTGANISGSSWGLLAGGVADGLFELTEEHKKRNWGGIEDDDYEYDNF